MSLKWRSDDTQGPWPYGFGRAKDGSTYSAPAIAGCSGSSASTTLTISTASTFANDDLILIYQTRGTGAGNYMLNRIVSGGGTTTLTLEFALDQTYTDSGASQAQVMELKEYENLQLTSTITPTSWNTSTGIGGIGGFFNIGTLTGNGSGILSLNGGAGTGNSSSHNSGGATTGGFKGGNLWSSSSDSTAWQGEGSAGAGGNSRSANGNGGGGGNATNCKGGGAGGGNASAGTNGTSSDSQPGSTGGSAVGNAELTSIFPGGGGGGGGRDVAVGNGGGGSGGGVWFIFSENIDLSGLTIRSNGGNGGAGQGPGGGGAGGSILFKCVNGTFGTNKATATGGSGQSGDGCTSGAGSVGRIHVDYSGSISGTSNPTMNTRFDSTIKLPSAGGGAFLYLLT